jgi:hypothetical protein
LVLSFSVESLRTVETKCAGIFCPPVVSTHRFPRPALVKGAGAATAEAAKEAMRMEESNFMLIVEKD